MTTAPSIKHWALLIGVAAIVGGLAGWLGSHAGGPAPQPTAAPIPATAQPVATNDVAATTVRTRATPKVALPAPSPPLIVLPERGSLALRGAGRGSLPAELPSVTGQLEEKSTDERLSTAEALLKRGTAVDKWDAIGVLAGTDDDRAFDIARRLVRSKDLDVATGAANVLAMGPGLAAEDVAALEEMTLDTNIPGGDRAGYNAAIMSAMRMDKAPGDFEAYAHKALKSDAFEVRGSAVANVVTLPSDRAVPLLIEALHDQDEGVANGAYMALVHAHGGDESLSKDPADWNTWWEKKSAAGTEDTQGAAPPVPDDFVRPEASSPKAETNVGQPTDPPMEEAAP